MKGARPAHVWAPAIVLAAVVLWAAGGPPVQSPAAQPSPVAGAPCAPGATLAGDRGVAVQSGGLTRTARLHVPRRAVGHPAALLVAFHGTGRNGRFMEGYSRLNAYTDPAGAITLYPDATGRRWNLDNDQDGAPDDVRFVADLLAVVKQSACVDPRRISVVGVSNGGGFAARLACVMADHLAAVVVVAGGFATLPDCDPNGHVSVLEIHGTDDPVVPYGGALEDDRRGAVRTWLAGWVQRDHCAPAVHRRIVARRVAFLQWTGCRAGTTVRHLLIYGGRHQWPGAVPPDPGPAATISAARETWAFVARRRSLLG